MKLNDVTLEGGYLVIHTDEGTRMQSMKWRGVGPLRAKAIRLIGKNIRTTTSGTWDPLTWFATIEEVLPASSSSNLSPPEVGTEIEFSVVAHRKEKVQVTQDVTDTLKHRVPIGISALILKAESGHAEAQFALAQQYDKAGTSRSLLKAMQWYQAAAEQGHKASLRVLKDREEMQCYQLAVDQGHKASLRVSIDREPDAVPLVGNLMQTPGSVTKIFSPPGTGKTCC